MLLWMEGYNYLSEIAISFPLEKYAEVGLQDYIIVLFLISRGIFILFPTVTAHIYNSINNVQVFSFLTFQLALVVSCLLDYRQVWSDISLFFWHMFPYWLVMLSMFLLSLPSCLPPFSLSLSPIILIFLFTPITTFAMCCVCSVTHSRQILCNHGL